MFKILCSGALKSKPKWFYLLTEQTQLCGSPKNNLTKALVNTDITLLHMLLKMEIYLQVSQDTFIMNTVICDIGERPRAKQVWCSAEMSTVMFMSPISICEVGW